MTSLSLSRRRSLQAIACLLMTAELASAQAPRKLQSAAGPATWASDLSAIAPSDWSYERAAHLLDRAGFGATPAEVEKFAKMTPKNAVAALINYESIPNPLPAFEESGIWTPAMLPDVDFHYDQFGDALRTSYAKGEVYGVKPNPGGIRRYQPVVDMLYYRGSATRAEWSRASIWWANRMLTTKRPLEEKMTLFWHGHFATEHEKVMDYRLVLNQLAMLRANGTGNFRDLLIGIAKDPAMLIYLDNRKNIKGQANENFAREIMELFALGVGNYTEKDIKEAGRAFTGWDNFGAKFVLHADLHDDGIKTVLGKSGNFTGEQVVDILLAQKACAEFMSRKLYRFFVREDVSPELNAKLATLLRENKYQIKPFLTAVFLSRDFYSAPSVGTQIKSPVQYVISTYRKMGLTEIPGTPYFPILMSGLGQQLGNPPNVKGWDGGKAWLNPSTLLQRGNLVRHALFPQEIEKNLYVYNVVPPRYINARQEAEDRDKQAAMGMERTSKPAADGGDMMMVAPSSNRLAKAPDYDLKLGVYRGYTRAYATVKPVPPTPASLSLKESAKTGGVRTAENAVDYFVTRFLSMPLDDADRTKLIAYAVKQLGGDKIDFAAATTESALRDVLYVLLSMPEFQLS